MTNVVHSTLTGTDLHEPKGTAAATSGQVYLANGAGSGVWTDLTTPTFMQKHIAGLTWQNAAGDTTNDIQILTGSCRDSTNTADMLLAASITKRVDATWVVGDAQGGLDTGAVANTTYHIHLIKKTDGTIDALFSTSATSPTMPDGTWTKRRRIGSFVRVAGVNQPIQVQELHGGGIQVDLKSTGSESVTSANAQATRVLTRLPSGVPFEATMAVSMQGGWNTVWGPPGLTLSTSSCGVAVPDSADFTTPFTWLINVLSTSAGIANLANTGASHTETVTVRGWKDFRRD